MTITKNRIFQPLLALILVWLIIFLLNSISSSPILWAVGASSLASTIFILFARPLTEAAEPKKVIFGYVIGVVCGEILHLLADKAFDLVSGFSFVHYMYIFEFGAAISVAISLLLMSIMRCEHPPAAGIALILVLDVRNGFTSLMVLMVVIFLVLLKLVLKKWLKNL